MYDSLFGVLLPLDGSLLVYPGHGAGSLCGKSIAPMRSTSLGYERRFNPSLVERSRESFIEYATQNLPEQPGNHRRIKEMNRLGPPALGELPPPLAIRQAIPYFQRGAGMLDTRSQEAFVALHVPGAVHLEADEQLSGKIGFVLPPDLPLVLLLEQESDLEPVYYALARVGYERQVAGYLSEGLEAWQALGLPVTSGDIADITPEELHSLLQSENGDRPVVLDVREPWEFHQGHVPGAVLIPLGELSRRAGELDPHMPVAVICATGSRSQSGAALLGQRQFKKIYNVTQGTHGWVRKGYSVER
jgi:rhodanese-related sulfurtransferase